MQRREGRDPVLILNQLNRRLLSDWRQNGEPVPPPDAFKQLIVKEYAQRFGLNTLIETGTCYGDMIYGVKDVFRQIYSVELSDELALYSQKRFSKYRNVEIIQGDSVDVLPGLLSSISGPCLMWLDAHYSSGKTVRGQTETPIMQELEVIFRNPTDRSCLLIDDARCFVGQDDYPEIGELEAYVKQLRPDWIYEVAHDIIRIHPHQSIAGSSQ